MISNIREVRSLGAKVILITKAFAHVDASLCDYHIMLPEMEERFSPFASAVVL